VDKALEEEISNDAQLSADERKQLENIKSRQVTLR
jgi:SEC-C domain protein